MRSWTGCAPNRDHHNRWTAVMSDQVSQPAGAHLCPVGPSLKSGLLGQPDLRYGSLGFDSTLLRIRCHGSIPQCADAVTPGGPMDESLPRPVASDWDWQSSAACRGLHAARFFHPENERGIQAGPDRKSPPARGATTSD